METLEIESALENKKDASLDSNKLGDIKYKKNFLFRVIFRIDFASEIKRSNQNLRGFHKSVKEIFKNQDKQILRGFEAKISENEFTHTDKQVVHYRFIDDEKEKILVLEPAALTLELTKYDIFDKFKSILNFVLEEFQSVFGDMNVSRTGLRYINTIILPRGDAFKWDNLLARELISAISFPTDKHEITRIMTGLELSKPDYRVNFRFGLYNSEYPDTVRRKEFALDYDCYTHEEKELSEVPEIISAFRLEIKNLFEASIKKGLRDKMGVINDGL